MSETTTTTTISVCMTEYFETSIVRESIDINMEDYPELAGMTREEAIDYIEANAWEMAATDEMFSSLAEQLTDMDISREDWQNESQQFVAE